jgi:hypothetical protein
MKIELHHSIRQNAPLSYAALNCRNALVHVFHILDTLHEHFDTESNTVIITIDTVPTMTFDLRAVIRPDSGT